MRLTLVLAFAVADCKQTAKTAREEIERKASFACSAALTLQLPLLSTRALMRAATAAALCISQNKAIRLLREKLTETTRKLESLEAALSAKEQRLSSATRSVAALGRDSRSTCCVSCTIG